ncbi:helix-turn-helix transcriptional regulator [Shewanella canadensis]|nr:helix-turn-helix transcriptional regulator [Shewanella canadensis]
MDWNKFAVWQQGLIATQNIRLIQGEDFALLSTWIEADVITITLVDTGLSFQHTWSPQLSEQDIAFYGKHKAHDVYLNTYLKQGLIGASHFMHDLLPIQKIQDPIFLDTLQPYFKFNHSLSQIACYPKHLYLIFTAHRFSKAFDRNARALQQQLSHSLAPWVLATHYHNLAQQQADFASQQCLQSFPLRALVPQPIRLTQAENQVLHLLIGGESGSEIARIRNVSKETIKSQIKSLLHKTGTRHQNELLSRYAHDKLFTMSP